MRKLAQNVSIVSALLFQPIETLAAQRTSSQPVVDRSAREVESRFRQLLSAENKQDLQATRAMFSSSPDTLFVGKAPPGAPESWAAFWGTDALNQIHELWKAGGFHLVQRAPAKVTMLSRDVAQLYAPMSITVSYAGQSGTPKPFLLIVMWVRHAGHWKVASDIAIPTSPSAHG